MFRTGKWSSFACGMNGVPRISPIATGVGYDDLVAMPDYLCCLDGHGPPMSLRNHKPGICDEISIPSIGGGADPSITRRIHHGAFVYSNAVWNVSSRISPLHLLADGVKTLAKVFAYLVVFSKDNAVPCERVPREQPVPRSRNQGLFDLDPSFNRQVGRAERERDTGVPPAPRPPLCMRGASGAH